MLFWSWVGFKKIGVTILVVSPKDGFVHLISLLLMHTSKLILTSDTNIWLRVNIFYIHKTFIELLKSPLMQCTWITHLIPYFPSKWYSLLHHYVFSTQLLILRESYVTSHPKQIIFHQCHFFSKFKLYLPLMELCNVNSRNYLL